MLLSELLRSDLIRVGLEATSRKEAISELVDVLVQQHEVSLVQRSSVLEAVFEREAERGTGMADGLAVPHGTTDAVEDILCALGTSRGGIDFDNIDGKPSHLVILLVAPKRNFVGEIRTLAGIKHLLDHDNLKAQIVGAADGASIYSLIEAEELKDVESPVS